MKIGAFYYLWYGRPVYSSWGAGIWQKSGSTHNPLLGRYNSRDEEVISKHIDWAKEAGIDFFAMNWSDADSWDDITLKNYYLNHPKAKSFSFCVFYDSMAALNMFKPNTFLSYDFEEDYSPGLTRGEKFVKDMDYLADTYLNNPQYLKVNGSHVIPIYNTSAFRNCEKYLKQTEINMGKRGIKLFLIADVVCWSGVKISLKNFSFLWNTPPKESLKTIYRAFRRLFPSNYEKDFSLSDHFKAITGYNLYSVGRIDNFLRSTKILFREFSDYAKSKKLHFIPTILPGYDDRHLNGFDRPILDRNNGDFYKKFWDTAEEFIDPELNMLFVTSFNELHEGTELEPSEEYKDTYIKLTKLLKNK
jgi:hypothetical protein